MLFVCVCYVLCVCIVMCVLCCVHVHVCDVRVMELLMELLPFICVLGVCNISMTGCGELHMYIWGFCV